MINLESERHCSLVLASHGSMAAENSNQPMHDLSHEIANSIQMQLDGADFTAVIPAFLNGEPAMTNVLDLLAPGDVVIVPVMTSAGYYLNKLPGKFAENESANQFRCFMTPVVGMHDSIQDLAGNRIEMLLRKHELSPHETTIVVVGHGTRRNPTSGDSTFALTRQLELRFEPENELKFVTGFLDQDPELSNIVDAIDTRHTLVVPFLISRGPHTTEDIPQAFGLPSGPAVEFPLLKQSESGLCICDLPVGMYPEIADVCLELATAAIENGTPIELPPSQATAGRMP